MAKNNEKSAHFLQQALLLHQQGQFDGAEKIYRRLIKSNSKWPQSYYFYGLLKRQQNKNNQALKLIDKAVSLEPHNVDYWKALAGALEATRDMPAAEAAYQQVVRLNAADLDALMALGNLSAQQQQWEKATEFYQQILNIQPNNINAQMNLSNLALEQEKYSEAERGYRKILTAEENQPYVLNNLGRALAGQLMFDEAEQCYRKAIHSIPDYMDALSNLGDLYLQKNNTVAASALFEKVLTLDGDNVTAMIGHACCLLALNNLDESSSYFQQALNLSPNNIEAKNGLGNCYMRTGDYQHAINCYEQVLVLNPEYKHAQFNLALALQKTGQIQLACSKLETLLQQTPDYLSAIPYLMHFKRQLCDWEGVDKLVKQCVALLSNKNKTCILPPFSLITLPESTATEHLLAAQYWQEQNALTTQPDYQSKFSERYRKTTAKKIRLGYVSADFHQHATAILLVRIIELHNRDSFEVIGYSLGPDDQSAMRERLVNALDEFYDVREQSSEKIAALINEHEIDILLDVKGLTQNHRAEIFLHRPSPVQVNYLAYPATMGHKEWDYFIGDNYVTPSKLQDDFTEQIINLSGCYQPADDQRDIPIAKSRSELDLPDDKVILAAFHQAYKLSPQLLDVWSDILKQSPQSLLWLLADNADLQHNLSKELTKRGVPSDRYVFAKKMDQLSHLNRLASADLFLDAYPVNAHTTASDALWAGVPVLTISGDTIISRVAGSLLKNVEMEELIANSFQDYCEKAVQLINQPERLSNYKQYLTAGRSSLPLFNSAAYTQHLEAAYHEMWQDYLSSLIPNSE